MDIKEIEIPIFINPHLFWIFYRRDTKKRLQLQNELGKQCYQSQQKDEIFITGEVVAVRKNLIWKRAVIESILEDSKNKYEVWLLDYGYLEHSSTVYKLDPQFHLDKFPPLVLQASLWNIVFINEDFNIEKSSFIQHRNTHPNAGAALNAIQMMGNDQLFFHKMKDTQGILFGDILFKKNGETNSLISALISKQLMVEDKELFSNVESTRINAKVSHLIALRQASKKHGDKRFSFDFSMLTDEVFMRNTARGISWVDVNQPQTAETIIPRKDLPKCELLRNLRKKTEMRKMEALSCTESEREEASVEDGRNPTLNSNKQVSKATKLKNLINLRRQSGHETTKPSCNDYVKRDTKMDMQNIEIPIPNKIAALKLGADKQKETERLYEKSKDCDAKPKILESPNTVFLHGGRSYHQIKKLSPRKQNTKWAKDKSSNYESDSADKSITPKKSPTSKINMMRKLAARNRYMSNNSDTSDAGMPNNTPCDTTFDTSSELPSSSVDEVSSNTNDVLSTNKANCESEENSFAENIASNGKEDTETVNKTSPEIKDNESENDAEQPFQNARDTKIVIKPYCTCSQCNFWTASEDWGIGSETFTEEGRRKRKSLRPPSLMLKEERAYPVKLASINYRQMTKTQKESNFKILVHGCLIPQPIDLISEAPFHSAIYKSLQNLKYKRTKMIQSYIWPAISRSMNVCFIHRKHTGKTLAYLPPLCSFLLEKEERYSDFKKGGPIVIILGKSTAQCEDIYDLANKLMEKCGHNKPKIVLVTYPFQHINLSSVDMLITIPPILIELLRRNATSLKRLCHMVFENIDVHLDRYLEAVRSVISHIESMLLQRSCRQSVQIITAGEHWTSEVEKFLIQLRELPLVAIGDYLEASIYGGTKLIVKLLSSEAKCDAVVDILRDKWKFHNCLIICNTNEEIAQVKTSLDLTSISYIAITEDLPLEEVDEKKFYWESQTAGQFIVLICTDETLHTMLRVTSASLVIHFSLPTKWSFWLQRFYCLLENYKSPLTKHTDKLKCEGYILTDELCKDQIPRLLSLLKSNNPFLKQYEFVCKEIRNKKEVDKIIDQVSLCTSLKQFGYCHKDDCKKRHLLDRELDCNNSLPQSGTIKFQIVKLIDVNHLKVQIVEHKDMKGNVTDFKSMTKSEDEKLTSILNQKRVQVQDIKEQSSYAFWDQEEFNDMFRECIVENVKSDVVDLLIKSDGRKTTVSKSKIFELPEEFYVDNVADEECIDVIIANFKPPYKDENFSARAFGKIKSYVEDLKYEGDDAVFVSNICLQLGNTIWVNTLRLEVTVYNVNVTKSNLTRELVRKLLADNNPDHMENLYKLCEDAEIILPEYVLPMEEKIVRERPQATPQWAFLETDTYNKIYFTSAVTPDEIYVRLAKYEPLLLNLEKDLSDVAMRQGSEQDFLILEGRYYIAKDQEEGKFIRVQIKKIENDHSLCFSVDYGDECIIPLKDIKYLSDYFIQKLPFQAIHCRLFGIKPIQDEWSIETVDLLYNNYTFEPDSDIYRTLYAKCMIYERGMRKGQNLFSILLKDVYEKPIIINRLFLDYGMAQLIPGRTLEDFEIQFTEDESEEEEVISDDENNEEDKVKNILDASKASYSNVIQPPKSNEYNVDDDDDNELEFFFFNSEDELGDFIDFVNVMVKNSAEQRHSTIRHNALPAIEAAPFEVDYLTPDIYWSQTKSKIDMCIKIPNVEEYSVKLLKSRIFNFETKVNEKKYIVNLVLHEKVQKEFKHTLGGLEIKIRFTKQKEEAWPKLSRSKTRLRNVHYVFSKEEMSDEEGDSKLFLDLGDDMKVEPNEDDDDDDDDGVFLEDFSEEDSEYEQEAEIEELNL